MLYLTFNLYLFFSWRYLDPGIHHWIPTLTCTFQISWTTTWQPTTHNKQFHLLKLSICFTWIRCTWPYITLWIRSTHPDTNKINCGSSWGWHSEVTLFVLITLLAFFKGLKSILQKLTRAWRILALGSILQRLKVGQDCILG